jgi:hypothetical protein
MSDYESMLKINLNSMDGATYGVRHASINKGKFITQKGPEHEETISQVNEKSFSGNDETNVWSSNRKNEDNGTEGKFEIWRGGKKVASAKWRIPYASPFIPGSYSSEEPYIFVGLDDRDDYLMDLVGFKVNSEEYQGHTIFRTSVGGAIYLTLKKKK